MFGAGASKIRKAAWSAVWVTKGDGQRLPLCMVPRAQRPLWQVLKMPRSLVLQPRLSAVPLVSRTSRGVFRHPVRACLRPVAEGIETEGLAFCRGIAEAEASGSLASAAAEPLRRRSCSRSRSRGRTGRGEPQPQPQPALGPAAAAAQRARHGDQYQRERERATDLRKKERR